MEPFKVLIFERRLLVTLKMNAHPFIWTHNNIQNGMHVLFDDYL